ncbi:FAD/NAD(P)-binding protein [Streptomyces sp. NPDC053048]|uniref:FAD/NAD(P)-binding protein n=1 Tax=Streptomyces sp. NPDC053048 TaxID=3365694 RepID=UPI0037D966B7
MQRIAVIGAGAAGACAVESLALHMTEPCSLTVLDGGRHLWRGRAYQPDDADVLTNIPAAHMSLRADDPGHAARWLDDRAPGALDAHGLTSRALYGAYLAETLSRTWRRLAHRGWRLRLVRRPAARLLPEGDGVLVVTADGRRERFDHVVLCAGPTASPDPYGLAAAAGYRAVPFPLSRTLPAVPADCHVGILGSGLTAVDLVAGLATRGHRGPVTLASRSGALPSVNTGCPPPPPRHLTLPQLESLAASAGARRAADLWDLIRAELRAAGADHEALRRELDLGEGPAERLRRQLAGGADAAALAVLRQALHRFAGQAWNLLPEHEQTALWRRHARAVTSLCCPMPRHRAALLLRLLDSGRLRVTGGLAAVAPAPHGGFTFTANGTTRLVDVLFNALNPAAPGACAPGPLEASVADRWGAGHPLGGLRTDRHTHRVFGADGGHTGIYALGHATRGAVLFYFGMPSLVHQSGLVARAVAAGTRAAHGAGGHGAVRSAQRNVEPGR